MPSPDEMFNPVTKPKHYNIHPSGIDCIKITEHMNFCIGNAIKYLWRAGEKGETLEDLKKARWYVDREIERLEQKSMRKLPEEKPGQYYGPHILQDPGQFMKRAEAAVQVHWELPFEHCEGCHSHVCRQTGACMHKVDDPH